MIESAGAPQSAPHTAGASSGGIATTALVASAAALIASAQLIAGAARDDRGTLAPDEPFAPSVDAASISSLGYREVTADLLFFRLIGYFGGQPTPEGVAALVEAIAAIDPMYEKIYTFGGRAMVAIRGDIPRPIAERAVALLERGAARFPLDYKIPTLIAEILLTSITPTSVSDRRALNERAAGWIESAVTKPGAPAAIATLAATLRSRLGQRQRAVDNLRELMLITDDVDAKKALLEKLQELEHSNADEIAAELYEAKRAFERAWRDGRPAVSASMFVLIGTPTRPGFDLGDLATGGRELTDLNATSEADPSSP